VSRVVPAKVAQWPNTNEGASKTWVTRKKGPMKNKWGKKSHCLGDRKIAQMEGGFQAEENSPQPSLKKKNGGRGEKGEEKCEALHKENSKHYVQDQWQPGCWKKLIASSWAWKTKAHTDDGNQEGKRRKKLGRGTVGQAQANLGERLKGIYVRRRAAWVS